MDDAHKPRYGPAINRIYTRSGASKRGRRVPSAFSFRATSPSGLSIAKRASPAGIVTLKKKKVFLYSASDFPGQICQQALIGFFS